MKNARKNLLAVVFLLFLAAFFMLPYFLTGSIPYAGDFSGSDLTELNLPLRYLAAEAFQQGRLPLWTDKLATGFPLLAEGQAGVFYPLNLLLYPFLPFSLAVNLGFLLNFFLAGLFTFFYCRALRISHWGSVLAAIAFAFGGFFVFRLKHLNLINAAIWLPLQFYLLEKYFNGRKKYNWLGLLAMVFAIQFFAGHPQISYVALMACLIYFCLKFFLQHKLDFWQWPREFFFPWLFLGVAIFGLCAVQFLPTMVNTLYAARGTGMEYRQIIINPYPPVSLFYFFSPYFLGNPATASFPEKLEVLGVFWENNLYFGLLPLLLALVGLIFVFTRRVEAKILALLVFFCYLFIFGDFSPVFIVFWHALPGLNMFRFPQRFLLPVALAGAALAGLGFDYLWQRLMAWRQNSGRLARSSILISVLLPIAVIAVAVTDLYAIDAAYLGSLNSEKYFSRPQSADFLAADKSDFRVYSVGWSDNWAAIFDLAGGWQNNLDLFTAGREQLPPNLNAFWGVASAQDRASLEGGMLARETQNLAWRLGFLGGLAKKNEKGASEISAPELNVFSLQNVKYFLSYRELASPGLMLVKEIKSGFLPALKIYENQRVLPRAFGVFSAVVATSTSAMYDQIFSPGFDSARQVTVIGPGAEVLTASSTAQAAIASFESEGGKAEVAAEFSADGYLVFSQSYLPGWQAQIDGRKVPLLRADYALTAVKVPAGRHEIVLAYQPLSFKIGLVVSAVTFGILILFFIIYNFKKQTFGRKEKI